MKNEKRYFEAVDKLKGQDYDVVADAYTELESKYYKALDEVKHLTETNHELYKQLGECNCELCNQCGAYRQVGLSACVNCRWYQ